MPCICEFLGIAIYMYYNDHAPAHFHAEYGDHEALFEISTLDVLRGVLPRRVHALVLEWAAQHRADLRHNWDFARDGLPLRKIEPLE